MSENLIGLIGGTGLGDALAKDIERVRLRKVETPFLPPSFSPSSRIKWLGAGY